ncbi:MAG: response regulator transcription factor [Gelidibacter sp.]
MENAKIYIVEDMGVTRAALISVLTRAGYVYAGSAASAEKAWLELPQKEVDVVIIDVNLKGAKDGIWLATKLKESMDCAIIFLTAYGSPAMLDNIHHTEPDGYIMKPFNNPTLLSAIRMACRNRERLKTDTLKEQASIAHIKTRKGIVTIDTKQIIYLMSQGNYVHIKTTDSTHEVRGKLQDILDQLPHMSLYRIHRRYAVNKQYIKSMDRGSIVLSTEEVLPISKTFDYDALLEGLGL